VVTGIMMRLSTFGILCWSAQAQPIMEDGDACTPWENGALPCGRDLQCVATWNNDGDGSYNDPICYPADTMFTMDHTDAGTCAANEDCAPTFWCDTDHDPPACESVLRDDDPVEPPVTEDPEGAALEGQPCTPWDHGSTPCAGRMQCVGQHQRCVWRSGLPPRRYGVHIRARLVVACVHEQRRLRGVVQVQCGAGYIDICMRRVAGVRHPGERSARSCVPGGR
jgi:hypothetical protein